MCAIVPARTLNCDHFSDPLLVHIPVFVMANQDVVEILETRSFHDPGIVSCVKLVTCIF